MMHEPQYLAKPPKGLQSLAIEQLARWVASEARKIRFGLIQLRNVSSTQNYHSSQAEESLHHQIEVIWNLLECNVPKMFHDRLAIELVRALSKQEDKKIDFRTKSMESDERNSYLETSKKIFVDYITTFVINYSATSNLHFTSLLYSGLKRLQINFDQTIFCIKWHIDQTNEANIIHMLKSLPDLKYITIYRACSDNILNCLVEHCKQIEELKLTSSGDVNDNSIRILIQFANLKVCDLGGTSVTKWGMANLLASCKHIEVIKNNYSNVVAEAVNLILSIDANTKLKLKYYESVCSTTYGQLKLVLQTCPQIQKLLVVKYKKWGGLHILDDLDNLTELILAHFNIREILAAPACGSKLVYLRLDRVHEVNLNSFIDISQTYPNLKTLIINCTLSRVKRRYKKQELEIRPFRYLKVLVFNVVGYDLRIRGTTYTHQPLKKRLKILSFILSNSTNIEYIRTTVPLTDDFMLKVLDQNPLFHLKTLKMCGNISALVIDRIIGNCAIAPVVN